MTVDRCRTPARPRRIFTYFWSASLVSSLGDGAVLAALPLLAASLTVDPRLIAAVVFTGRLPWLTVALFGGVIVDRADRRRLMLFTQVGQMLVVAVIAAVAGLHVTQIWMLYVLAFVMGCADVLFMSASQAFVPTIVEEDDLDAANGRLVAAESASRDFLGPPIGSALFAVSSAVPFLVDAISFGGSVLLLLRIKPSPTSEHRASSAAASRSSVWTDIREGLRWLMRSRLPRLLTLISAAGNFCEAMALSLLVLFARDVLNIGPAGYGVLLAAMAAGAVIGGLFSARVVKRFGARRIAIAVEVISPLAWLAIAAIGHSPIVMVGLFAVFSMALSMRNVVSSSTRQRLIPNEMLGRVTAASRMLAYGATPLGALAGGFVAAQYGLVAPWMVGGVLSLLVAVVSVPLLWRWDSPPRGRRTRQDPPIENGIAER
ncbi:MFS transporter [Planctomonas sp. JC2975]|uniref:MFS transporter n=1 Tax=Planctomonas sp. JC2975 TaxID=2729626 RepID=UPI001473C328|nr:MFS transporter [Planctomonas sp. JC2975]NNC13739.1 MFS transporter [Planctomonas sp. JC2975]